MGPPAPPVEVSLSAVLFTLRQAAPQILTIQPPPDDWTAAAAAGGLAPPAPPALPFGPLDPVADVTLERALLGWVRRQTGLELDWLEQLYTFGDQHRDPRELSGGRAVSVAYLAIVEAGRRPGAAIAHWRPVYGLLPWEDWREGRPALIGGAIEPVLLAWAATAPAAADRAARRERVDIAFGLGRASWDSDRALDRYELLYEVGLVAEAHVDARLREASGIQPRYRPWLGLSGGALLGPVALPGEAARLAPLGEAMLHDHRRILATALGRLRGKLRYRPVVFELLADAFTLTELQRVVEALTGQGLHAGNFRRLVESIGLVEPTGQRAATGGRPAERYRFRREVLRERRSPGLGLSRRRG